MKTFFGCVVFSLTLMLSIAVAVPPPPRPVRLGKPGFKKRKVNTARERKFDANHDGYIGPNEAAAMRRRVRRGTGLVPIYVASYDDGIEPTDRGPVVLQKLKQAPPVVTDEVTEAYDVDGDGVLSPQEKVQMDSDFSQAGFAAVNSQVDRNMDINRDGYVSGSERAHFGVK